MFPHFKREAMSHGGSPGNGITPMKLSRDPLATEGEATPGPDDWNPYEEAENRRAKREWGFDGEPTKGDDDPFLFDDIGMSLEETVGNRQFEFPKMDMKGPEF